MMPRIAILSCLGSVWEHGLPFFLVLRREVVLSYLSFLFFVIILVFLASLSLQLKIGDLTIIIIENNKVSKLGGNMASLPTRRRLVSRVSKVIYRLRISLLASDPSEA